MSSATVTTVAKGHSAVKSVKKSSKSSPTDHHRSSPNDSNLNLQRSYKKKDNCVSLVDVDNPELGLKTSIETSENIPPPSSTTTKVGWKNSKIFSRTLSSIEVIRAMKSKSSSSSTSNSLTTSPINPSSSSTEPPIPSIYYGDRLGRSSPSSDHPSPSPPPPHPASHSSSSSNSKTSAMTSNQENEGNSAARRSKALSEWKTLKSKLSSLRKKSSSNSDDNCGNNDNNDDRSNRRTSGSNRGSARTSRSGSQDEGIVCKREDLINLLYEAARAAASKSHNRKNSPEPNEPTSPSGGTSRKGVLSPKNTSSNISVSIGQSVTTTTTSIPVSMNNSQGTPSLSPKVSKKSSLKKNTTSDIRVKMEESVDFVETKIVCTTIEISLKTRYWWQ